jgi:hypothetical protein
MSHALCKSSDMIHWEYVCDIPLQQATEEVAICIYNGYLYATSRGNPGNDGQSSKIIRCPMDNLTALGWSTPIVLYPCRGERPAIAGITGHIYVMQCIGNISYDGIMPAPRGLRAIYVFDTELNFLNEIDMAFNYPILHPSFFVLGGNLFTVLSSDKRCYSGTAGGDGRSELSFAHLDHTVFDIGMDNLR